MQRTSKLAACQPEEFIYRLVHPVILKLTGMGNRLPISVRLETEDLLTETYSGSNGSIIFRFDGVRVVIEAFCQELQILKCAIRDRQLDGTEATSPLTAFPNSDPACNRLPAPGFLCAELSIYAWDPASYLKDLDQPNTLGNFIQEPDSYIWQQDFDPRLFSLLWIQAVHSGLAPWQRAKPLSGVAAFFVRQSGYLLHNLGYHRVDAVPSWFNVAKFFNSLGYTFTYGEHNLVFTALSNELTARFSHLTSSQQSWLVALQNIPEKSIPQELRLSARWPVTHTNMYWVRMHRDLNNYQLSTDDNGFRSRIPAL